MCDKLICAYIYYCTFGKLIFGFTKEELLSFDPVKYRKEIATFWWKYYNNKLDKEIVEKLEECF